MLRKVLLTFVLALFLLSFGMMSKVSALSFDGTEGYYYITGKDYLLDDYQLSTSALDTADVENLLGLEAGSLDLLYKTNVSGGGYVDEEEGLWANFSTEYIDAYNAIITYSGDPIIFDDPLYLLAKDGVHWQKLFDISGWDVTFPLHLIDLHIPPDQGAISHLQIMGSYERVPEPGMVILLGIGLIGLAFFSRKRLLN